MKEGELHRGIHPQQLEDEVRHNGKLSVFDESVGADTDVLFDNGLKIVGQDGNRYPITKEWAASFRLTKILNDKLK